MNASSQFSELRPSQDIKDQDSLPLVTIGDDLYYKITDVDTLRPFLMSMVSDSNHWMFISSNGGLTAGRKNADCALFPYYTDDKIAALHDITGSKSIFQITRKNQVFVWEPFSERFNDSYRITRNLYKCIYGNKLIFEEIHHDFELAFSYQWCTSNFYGFIKNAEITNRSKINCEITLLDGLQNILPYGVSSDLQANTSNLVDAYKRSELLSDSGVGIYSLSARIVDKAEPSEALKANVVWSIGFAKPSHLLSSLQLGCFRKKNSIISETDIKGEPGAYFVSAQLHLKTNTTHRWKIIANVNQTHAQIVSLAQSIVDDINLEEKIIQDINLGTKRLIELAASADGLQFTADHRKDARHFANVLFNTMRGGVFDNNYQIEKHDFSLYIAHANSQLYKRSQSFLSSLPVLFSYHDLKNRLVAVNDPDLLRLGTEYLPLKFSRRHGDPSRPWNKFSINTQNENDGSKLLDYQGNWRDIFQNWEALAWSYPDFIDGMIHKFLNASTFDGYNPYRVAKSGFDWEIIEPENPWSYIGYWGDHQIIYLLKFLEFKERYEPGALEQYFNQDCFVYAAVPYTIKSYQEIVQDPKNTIVFDRQWHQAIEQRRSKIGADGALLIDYNKRIYYVNFIEKVLAMLLAKMSNFIPEGGIWMNTQRPEWNDANNALVGNGVSMVTLYYLRRFFVFFQSLLENSTQNSIRLSGELVEFYHAVRSRLMEFSSLLEGPITDQDRKKIIDALGSAGAEYRNQVYKNGFWGKKRTHSMQGLKKFTQVCLTFIDHTIQANKREDNLYHAYNLITSEGSQLTIARLSEMLEGQVAILSAGYLSTDQAIANLNALRSSHLYREDQQSYLLYPNKELPHFIEKNIIPAGLVAQSSLLQKLLENGNSSIIERDIRGELHFNGNFRNSNDLLTAINNLELSPEYKELVAKDRAIALSIFEAVFNHKSFTGRSGTFFAYEGLGSIYWHMVSKLHLAVVEVCEQAISAGENDDKINSLVAYFDEIGFGIGIHKSPQVYGAFPTDPYSHTPWHRGAQQPGMTGQVKEDILIRLGELGIKLSQGKVQFQPHLLKRTEFLPAECQVNFVLVNGTSKTITIPKGALAFTFCQVPVVYQIANTNKIEVYDATGSKQVIQGLALNDSLSRSILLRTNEINQLTVFIKEDQIKR